MKINTNKQFNEIKHKFLTSEDEHFRFYSGMKFTDEYMNEMIEQSVSIKYKDLRPENFSNTKSKVLKRICEISEISEESFPASFSNHLKKEMKTWKNCFRSCNRPLKSNLDMEVNVLNILNRYKEELIKNGEINLLNFKVVFNF